MASPLQALVLPRSIWTQVSHPQRDRSATPRFLVFLFSQSVVPTGSITNRTSAFRLALKAKPTRSFVFLLLVLQPPDLLHQNHRSGSPARTIAGRSLLSMDSKFVMLS